MSTAWHDFVPAGARASVADLDAAPLVSGQLLARHAVDIAAPVIEVTATRAASLIGVLRACRQARALVVVAVPAAVRRRTPDAGAHALRGVAAAAAAAHHDLPIVVVARADRGGEAVDRDDLAGLGRDIVAGYGALGVDAAACADTAVLLRLMHVADELDLGIEFEIAAGDDLALLLAEIDDRGLPVSAIRGAAPMDETGRASRVIDIPEVTTLRGLDAGGLRVNIDAITAAITGTTDDEIEARTWLEVSRVLRALRADDTADRLARALGLGASS